ncbi:hypothetical protein ACTQ6A_14555 [Lachnospiraceae bacterium LCP25S3_G4]
MNNFVNNVSVNVPQNNVSAGKEATRVDAKSEFLKFLNQKKKETSESTGIEEDSNVESVETVTPNILANMILPVPEQSVELIAPAQLLMFQEQKELVPEVQNVTTEFHSEPEQLYTDNSKNLGMPERVNLLSTESTEVSKDFGIVDDPEVEESIKQGALVTKEDVSQNKNSLLVEHATQSPNTVAQKEKLEVELISSTEQDGKKLMDHMLGHVTDLKSDHVLPNVHEVKSPSLNMIPVSENQEIPNQVMDKLMEKLATRVKEFEIQLEPAHLGKIGIKVIYEQTGVSIALECSNSRTMQLLSQCAKDIGGIIENNLGSPTTIFVEKGEANYLEQEHQNQGQNQGQQQQEEKGQQQPAHTREDSMDFIQQFRLGLIEGLVK